jgi:hypothetical protein
VAKADRRAVEGRDPPLARQAVGASSRWCT